ncbi:MAG: response regulator [Thermodesulfovibrionales bacterium]|nr:response regulator [Thermodesulfovibrionales bacterium]
MNTIFDILDTTKELNVLVVDDEPSVRNYIHDAIHDKFNLVVKAENGLEGLELFKKGRFDLIITDQKMPRMTGIAMIKEIRKITPDVPIIMITAYTETDILLDAINMRVEQFLIKPVMIDVLYKAIISALGMVIAKKKMQMEREMEVLRFKEQFNTLQKKMALKKQHILTRNDLYYKKITSKSGQTWFINTKYMPYDILSGDFYSIRLVDDGVVLIIFIDAMGKGLSAFVSSAIVTAFLNNEIDRLKDKKQFDITQLINNLEYFMIKQLSEDEAVCISLLLLDLNNEDAQILNCGMPPAFVISSDKQVMKIHQDYMPIVKMDNICIKNRFSSKDASKIVLMSDGLYEPSKEDTITQYLLNSSFISILADKVKTGLHKVEDDMTIIFIKRFNPTPLWEKSFEIMAKIDEVHKLLSELEMVLIEMELNMQFVVETLSAVNEMLMNAYEHGSLGIGRIEKNRLLKLGNYEGYIREREKEISKMIYLDVKRYNEDDVDYFTFTVRDEGEGFDTMIIKETITDLDTLNYRGIKITKGLVDEFYYNNIGNEVILIKRHLK